MVASCSCKAATAKQHAKHGAERDRELDCFGPTARLGVAAAVLQPPAWMQAWSHGPAIRDDESREAHVHDVPANQAI